MLPEMWRAGPALVGCWEENERRGEAGKEGDIYKFTISGSDSVPDRPLTAHTLCHCDCGTHHGGNTSHHNTSHLNTSYYASHHITSHITLDITHHIRHHNMHHITPHHITSHHTTSHNITLLTLDITSHQTTLYTTSHLIEAYDT